MSPVTRSRDILSEIDGLFFIERDVIDLAANLYAELRAAAANFGDGSIKRLVPHVTSLLNKLNDVSKNNSDLKQEADSLRSSLSASEERCLDLNESQAKIEPLVAERRALMTTVEVLEAEMKCLRGELRGRRERANLQLVTISCPSFLLLRRRVHLQPLNPRPRLRPARMLSQKISPASLQ
ncbi:hypothetical protein J6590_069091 [Homalodisca vitripennis]|nr:hypothetical protein J6590_069091 [Homalodisca vitripennis]